MWPLLFLRLFLSLLFLVNFAFAFSLKYDKYFKTYGQLYFPFLEWYWFKAQAIQESSLNPKAKSYVGALGLMQIMPSTGKELGLNKKQLLIPELNIHAGIRYDYKIHKWWSYWDKNLQYIEKLFFIFASYNAGAGHIKKAWKLCNYSKEWNKVAPCLKKVTGRHSKETLNYVSRIIKYYILLVSF